MGALNEWLYEFTDDLTNRTSWEATGPMIDQRSHMEEIEQNGTRGDEINVKALYQQEELRK